MHARRWIDAKKFRLAEALLCSLIAVIVRLFLLTVLQALSFCCKTSVERRPENLALRQQLAVLRRSAPKRLPLTPADGWGINGTETRVKNVSFGT